MGCTFFWVKFGNAFAYFVISCLLARWRYYSIYMSRLRYPNKLYFDCKTKLGLIVPGRQGNYILHKKVSMYKVYSTISINKTHFDCKHKHMMKSGAPPEIVEGLHRLLPIEFHDFTSIIDYEGLSLF